MTCFTLWKDQAPCCVYLNIKASVWHGELGRDLSVKRRVGQWLYKNPQQKTFGFKPERSFSAYSLQQLCSWTAVFVELFLGSVHLLHRQTHTVQLRSFKLRGFTFTHFHQLLIGHIKWFCVVSRLFVVDFGCDTWQHRSYSLQFGAMWKIRSCRKPIAAGRKAVTLS